eukprot:PLAT6648.2.p1 GENE.PLAT6648.2~~PLAT6648.2.p1  ORF type:complete len:395 (-),score=166.15 PLAT6648.2:84-1187(-)
MAPWAALITGAIGSTFHMLVARLVMKRLLVDDPLAATAVHAGGGLWGLLAVGLFDTSAGLLTTGQGALLAAQALLALCIFCWSAAMTAVVILAIDAVSGVRQSPLADLLEVYHDQGEHMFGNEELMTTEFWAMLQDPASELLRMLHTAMENEHSDEQLDALLAMNTFNARLIAFTDRAATGRSRSSGGHSYRATTRSAGMPASPSSSSFHRFSTGRSARSARSARSGRSERSATSDLLTEKQLTYLKELATAVCGLYLADDADLLANVSSSSRKQALDRTMQALAGERELDSSHGLLSRCSDLRLRLRRQSGSMVTPDGSAVSADALESRRTRSRISGRKPHMWVAPDATVMWFASPTRGLSTLHEA